MCNTLSATKSTKKIRATGHATRIPLLFLVITLGLTAGCITVGPDYERPEPVMPDQWRQELVQGLDEGDVDLRTWWETFDDPILNSLIERATAANLDLKIAYARIKEARAQLGIATGERYPDINSSGDAVREKVSEGVFETPPPPRQRTDNFSQLSVDGSWEIDLWGRVRRSIESAGANYQASVEDYRDVLVVLYAEVARNYIQLRTLQERIRLAWANVEDQRQTLELVVTRERAGLAPKLDVRQAELNLATTESTIPTLEAARIAAINRLGVLLGQPPHALHAELTPVEPIPRPPMQVAVELPAELVRQRPDLRRTERVLASQTARIGVATAALYPNFSLAGTFGYATFKGDLLDASNETWSLGPFFTWNLFDGGRVRSAIRVEDARAEQALVNYEQSVLNALEDVENAMTGFAQERVRQASLARSVVAAQESVRLVKVLYRTGLTDFQNVLDMERSLFQQQDLAADSQGTVAQNLVRIYRAFGGGWEPDGPAQGQEETYAEDNQDPEVQQVIGGEPTDPKGAKVVKVGASQ